MSALTEDEQDAVVHSLRGPLLVMPPDMWADPDKIAAKVARVLNDSAHLFFDSAAPEAPQ